jgi:hypothetical protein
MKSVVYSLPPRKPSEANLARLGASCYAVLVVQPDDRTPPGHVAVPIPEAARRLGISEEAVRGRIKRGTLKSTKVGGRTHALLNDRLDADSTHAQSTAQSELVAELRTHVADLREQLEQAHERDRENRRIIAALTQRIPELEAPGQEPPESPTEATEQPGRVGPQATVEGPQGSSERVSWWRRLFGG